MVPLTEENVFNILKRVINHIWYYVFRWNLDLVGLMGASMFCFDFSYSVRFAVVSSYFCIYFSFVS